MVVVKVPEQGDGLSFTSRKYFKTKKNKTEGRDVMKK